MVFSVERLTRPRSAAGIIICHNHPSGDPEPWAGEAGRLLDMAVLDHMIVGRDGYVPLRGRGLAFDRR